MSDWADTLERLAEGDLAAFDRVIRLVTGYLARIGAYDHRDSWDDFVQEVLISILKKPPSSQESAAIVRHIQTTTYRKFVDQIRRERGRRRSETSDDSESEGWRRTVPFDDVAERAQAGDLEAVQTGLDEGLRKALSRLGDRERKAVECRYMLGCSNDEGAERLEVSLATYKRILNKALGELRSQLVHPGEPP